MLPLPPLVTAPNYVRALFYLAIEQLPLVSSAASRMGRSVQLLVVWSLRSAIERWWRQKGIETKHPTPKVAEEAQLD